MAGEIFVRAPVEHVPLAVFVLFVVFRVPLLLVQGVFDLRVQVSRVLRHGAVETTISENRDCCYLTFHTEMNKIV